MKLFNSFQALCYRIPTLCLLWITFISQVSFIPPDLEKNSDEILMREIQGAWKMIAESTNPWEDVGGWAQVKLISRGYFMLAVYDSRKRDFRAAAGGTYAIRNGKYTEYVIFHTVDPSLVGRSFTFQVRLSQGKLIQKGDVRIQGMNMFLDEEYQRIDYGSESAVAGAWRLQVPQEAYINSQSRSSTLMLTSGTRFQRVTYNSSTKQVYSAEGGPFFFRDNQWSETHRFNSRSMASINRRFSYPARYEGRRLGIKKQDGYKPDTYTRMD